MARDPFSSFNFPGGKGMRPSRRRSKLVGIDLGTTVSAIASLDDHGQPMTLPNRDGDMHTPSAALLLDDSTAVLGHAPFEESAARVPGRSRSDPLGPQLDSPTRNSGVIRGVSADSVSTEIP
jgi:molecular chaperone DnaK (HSP70)